MRMLNQLVSLDVEKGEVTVQAGMLTTHLLAVIMPLGYTLVGLTGSLGNTIGGEIGNDVNGKDSWHAGNFGSNVLGLKVATGMGEIIDVDRQHNPEWCNAIIGGMGLTGVILEVRLKLKRIPSFVLRTNTGKCNNITALLSEMNNLDKSKTDFAYCWTDPWAPESSLGRGLIETACFIESEAKVTTDELLEAFKQKDKFGPLSPETFWSVFRRFDFMFTYRYAGYVKFLLAGSKTQQVRFPQYQYPMLKHLPQWNLKYYPHGFREWQILISAANFEKAYKEILLLCRKEGFTPYVCAIRKHIAQSPWLSFAGNGFSMTVNYGLNDHPTEKRKAFENALLDMTISFSGKIYLGKYPFFNKPVLQKMYPELERFLQVKKQYDPNNLFWSDAAEMLMS
jgi:hypothetical protein